MDYEEEDNEESNHHEEAQWAQSGWTTYIKEEWTNWNSEQTSDTVPQVATKKFFSSPPTATKAGRNWHNVSANHDDDEDTALEVGFDPSLRPLRKK